MAKPASPTTIARRPKPSPQARRQAAARRRVERADEQRQQQAEQAQRAAVEADEKKARQVRDVVMARGGQAGLDGLALRKFANSIEAQRARATAKGETFDVYGAMKAKLAAMGHGLRAQTGSPLDAQLPPPPQQGQQAPPGVRGGLTPDEQQRAAQAEAAQRKGQRLREQQQAERERYEARLAELGLQRPDVGMAGSGGGLGL